MQTRIAGKAIRAAWRDDINKENVHRLEVAWTFRTGDPAVKGAEDQNTPIQIGGSVLHSQPIRPLRRVARRIYAFERGPWPEMTARRERALLVRAEARRVGIP